MKKSLILYIWMMLQVVCSCASDSAASGIIRDLKEFSVYVGDTKYTGVIDDKAKEVRIGGISYPYVISKVEWKLGEGVVMNTPDPASFMNNWKKEMSFSIRIASGEDVTYKVILNDYKDISLQKYKSVGYVLAGHYKWKREKVKWDYLTHLVILGVNVDKNAELAQGAVAECIEQAVEDAHNHGVKIMVSITRSEGLVAVAKDAALRTKLVNNLLRYAEEHQLDGWDIDYECDSKNEFKNILELSKEMYTKKGSLLYTSAVWAKEYYMNMYTDQWHRYFDWLNVMAYDFGGWGPDGKLEGQHSSYDDTVQGINVWMNKLKAPAEKLILGVPFYGFTWDNLPGEEGNTHYISYADIMKTYPEAIDDDQVGRTYYNGRATIKRKCEFMKGMGLSGIMIWHIFYDSDDENFSLLKVVNDELNKKINL